ncbi:MAG: PAS domain S-box protein [Azonexus sp.]|nr:SpoIIE family protein phosphatase [Azonexus sp.]MCK6411500.1 PAS domain S-box protein [Azonexus sp.]
MAGNTSLKVLAVDDNRTNLHILQVFLKKLGHRVILAENGEEAVQRFADEEIDVVLLDIMMPVMDGFEASRRIKAMSSERWTPIILLSALNRDENLVEGLEAGADDYLTKPINFVVLEAKLRSVHRTLTLQQQSIDTARREQAVADNIIDAIITIDDSGTIATVNRATTRIFGWSSEELVGNNVRMLAPEPHRSAHDSYIANYLSGGPPKIIGHEREIDAQHKDGHTFPATLGVTEVFLDNQRMFIGVVRDISERKQAERKLQENASLLQAYYDQTQNEQQLAQRLMEKQLHRKGLKDRRLRYKVIPAENFSGDIVAADRSPEGRFYALLADATGHGLPAAISALPVLAIFYRLARLNSTLREMVHELNQQLKESMPIGRFVAATLVCLDEEAKTGEIWVGGTPQAFLFDRWGRASRSFESDNLALGIIGNEELDCKPTAFTWDTESQLILCSDGLLEAENNNGVQFGTEGLFAAIANTSPEDRFARIESALSKHLQDQLASDDVSLMVIDCP